MPHFPSGNMEFDIQYQRRYEYSGSFILYEGIAPIHVEEIDKEWIIKKYTNDGTNITKTSFANRSNNFTLQWSERASYFYL